MQQRTSTTAILYSLPGVGVNFLFNMMLVMYMNFATDVLHVAAGALGLIFLVSKVWDGISDPLAGYLSDRTRSRLGRRKSWMLASSVPLGVFSLAAWAPPRGIEGALLTAWVAISVFGFYTAFTVFEVPHLALGAELSHGPRERNRIFAMRHLFRILGVLMAFGIGVELLEDTEGARNTGFWMALIVGLVTAGSLGITVFGLPRERGGYTGRGGISPWQSVRDVWHNPHARLLLFVHFIEQAGTGGMGAVFPYVMEHVVGRRDLLSNVLIIYSVSNICAIPVWLWLGNRFEKHKLWIIGMCGSCSAFIALSLFLAEGRVALMMGSLVVIGASGCCASTIGYALKADIIDYDEYQTGERKEGAYFAAWNFVQKLGLGLMVGMVGLVLQSVGYEGGTEQTPETKRAMMFLMANLPVIGYGIGIIVFSRFRLSQADHARMRAEIDARGENDPS